MTTIPTNVWLVEKHEKGRHIRGYVLFNDTLIFSSLFNAIFDFCFTNIHWKYASFKNGQ